MTPHLYEVLDENRNKLSDTWGLSPFDALCEGLGVEDSDARGRIRWDRMEDDYHVYTIGGLVYFVRRK